MIRSSPTFLKSLSPTLRGLGGLLLTVSLSTPAEARKRKKDLSPQVPAADSTDAAERVVLPCSWAEGIAFAYAFKRRSSDTRNPLLEQVPFEASLNVTVTGSGDPARFRYAVSDSRFTGPEEAVESVRNFMDTADSLPTLTLRMEGGNLTAIENFDAVIDETWPIMLATFQRGGAPDAVIAQTEALMRNPETGMPLILKEPSQFFAMHCVGMRVGEVHESAVSYPNPFGGPPIAGFSRVTMTEHDTEAGRITIETLDRTDPEAIPLLLESMMKQLESAGLTESEVAERMEAVVAEMPPIHNVLTGRMVYSTVDGFPVFVEVSQEVGAEGHPMRRVDTRSWTRVPDASH